LAVNLIALYDVTTAQGEKEARKATTPKI